ncbi:hypothetical protein MHYP_G00170430 [Metynnis hypsauchen]
MSYIFMDCSHKAQKKLWSDEAPSFCLLDDRWKLFQTRLLGYTGLHLFYIMDIFLPAFFLWLVTCTGSLSAQSRIYISVKAGSSAVLPCDWRNKTQSSGERPHIEWRSPFETVFERRGRDQYQGEGYEHRVDVPEDKLLSGDCSLVLKDVRLTDAGPYESYLLQRRTRRSLRSKRVFIQAVELSVEEISEDVAEIQIIEEISNSRRAAIPVSSNAGVIQTASQITVFILLTNIFCHSI